MDTNQNAYMELPGISPEELGFLQKANSELNENQKKYFFSIYSKKRKSPQDVLLYSIIGLILLPGLQRFMTGKIGLGVFYLLTWGLGFILSIVDIANHKKIALEFNRKMAYESYQLAAMSN